MWDDAKPLFPFGFGLSYTTFEIANVRLGQKRIRGGRSTHALADITNTGTRAGSEVVQMYIRDLVSSVTRPVKELKGFKRVSLEPGETQTVTFDITPQSLAFYNVDMHEVVEPGDFEIMIGNSSRNCDLKRVILRVDK